MAIHNTIEDLAKATALTDAQDLGGLVDLQEMFAALGKSGLTGDLAILAELAEKASVTLEEIVMRQVEDENASFELIKKTVEYAQDLVEAIDGGKSGDQLPRSPFAEPAGDGSGAETEAPIDEELLSAWVSGCEFALNDLENTCVEIDSSDQPDELIAEVRRTIHTLKGESGVLSLNISQKLCHEAESLIDARIDKNEKFPVDPVLALIDWMKIYISTLAGDPRARPPAHEDLLAQLTEVVPEQAGSTPEVTPEAEPASESTSVMEEDSESIEEAPAVRVGAPDDDDPVVYPDDLGMDENLSDFTCEALEHLHEAEQALLELENDFEDVEVINTVFRAFHTIKGVAGFMNLNPIVELAHNAETMLDKARNAQLILNSDLLDLILESCDLLTQLIKIFEDGTPPTKGMLANLIDRLKCATEGKPIVSDEHPLPDYSFPPLGEILISMEIITAEQLHGALERQKQGAEALRNLLVEGGLHDVDAVEQELLRGSETGKKIQQMLVEMDLVDQQKLQDAIEARRDSKKRIGQLLDIESDELAPALREQRRIQREGQAPEESTSSSASSASQNAPEQSEPASSTPTSTPSASPKASASQKRIKTVKRADQTVKVNTTRLDSLVDMVGELVIAQQMVVQDPEVQDLKEQRTQRNLTHVGKIIRDLQEVAMALRMVTVKGTFQKMARLVRDVSAKAGKDIKFVMEGEETELDRNVVEEIGDPLVHMIRNSCDHGIEIPSDRVKAGKAPTGTLTLRAFHQGGSIVIEVEDDGLGLPKEKIYNKAVEKGIFSSDKPLEEIPDSEIYNLIFLPGFSTAEKVTDISGRGVGMDVVRRNIESLRGKVEIRSTPGKGSIFSIRLPLTLAIIDGMIMRVGGQRYVIPTLAIEQSFRPKPSDLSTVNNRGEMVSVRGSLLPIYRLNRVFNVHGGIDDLNEALLIVLETADSRCCLMIDEIIGQQQVVIKSLGQGINSIRGISGGAILGDGRVALIIDVDGLVRVANSKAA